MNSKPYVVLVGVDHLELADRALQEAFALASQRENAHVHALSILPLPSNDPRYGISVYAALDERATLDTAVER
ncbi:MAG: universal stress protein, partial [Polyangiaceae bacterium]